MQPDNVADADHGHPRAYAAGRHALNVVLRVRGQTIGLFVAGFQSLPVGGRRMPRRPRASRREEPRPAAVTGDGGADPVVPPVTDARIEGGDANAVVVDMAAHADDLALDGHRVVGVHAAIAGVLVAVAGWDRIFRVHVSRNIQPDGDRAG